MHDDRITELCTQISAENNPKELIALIERLRKVLAEEQRRIEALLAKNEASRSRNAKDQPASKAAKATQ